MELLEVDIGPKKNSIEDIFIRKVSEYKNPARTIDIDSKLNLLRSAFGESSDPNAIEIADSVFRKLIQEENNPEAYLLLDSLINAISEGHKIELQMTNGGAYWNAKEVTVYINSNSTGDFIHEITHPLFEVKLKHYFDYDYYTFTEQDYLYKTGRIQEKPALYELSRELETFPVLHNDPRARILQDAIKISTENGKAREWLENFYQRYRNFKSRDDFAEEVLKRRGFESYEHYVKELERGYSKVSDSEQFRTIFRNLGYTEESINQVLTNSEVTPKLVAEYVAYDKFRQYNNHYANFDAMIEGDKQFCSIIEAIFAGKTIDNNGKQLNYVAGHGANYYSQFKNKTQIQFKEILGEYASIRLSGREDLLIDLERIFGKKLCDELDREYMAILSLDCYKEFNPKAINPEATGNVKLNTGNSNSGTTVRDTIVEPTGSVKSRDTPANGGTNKINWTQEGGKGNKSASEILEEKSAKRIKEIQDNHKSMDKLNDETLRMVNEAEKNPETEKNVASAVSFIKKAIEDDDQNKKMREEINKKRQEVNGKNNTQKLNATAQNRPSSDIDIDKSLDAALERAEQRKKERMEEEIFIPSNIARDRDLEDYLKNEPAKTPTVQEEANLKVSEIEEQGNKKKEIKGVKGSANEVKEYKQENGLWGKLKNLFGH